VRIPPSVTGIRPSRWTEQHLGRLTETPATSTPVATSLPPRVVAHHDIWDPWPVQDADGRPLIVDGEELWMALSAPAVGHPEQRHDHARIRLLAKAKDEWRDRGPVFPEGSALGSRQWSGSAVRRSDGTISVFYTAAGRHGEARPTFRQRVAEARMRITAHRGRVRLDQHGDHREILGADGHTYLTADELTGSPGRIRAFRDPGWFRDPADGQEYLLVAASVPGNDHFMGAVALARATSEGWTLLAPLLVADGINREIELPHLVVHESRYYLFVSTSRHSFQPPGSAPTGLYGFVAPTLYGAYEPLNRSGLVLHNPSAHPDLAYAWHVLPDLRVASFLNYRSVDGVDARRADEALARSHFAGTIAPMLDVALAGRRSTVAR
jgi:levansucrase